MSSDRTRNQVAEEIYIRLVEGITSTLLNDPATVRMLCESKAKAALIAAEAWEQAKHKSPRT